MHFHRFYESVPQTDRFYESVPQTAGSIVVCYTTEGDQWSESISPDQARQHDINPYTLTTWLHAEILWAEPGFLGGCRLYRDGARGQEITAHEYEHLKESGQWASVVALFLEADMPRPAIVHGSSPAEILS
jgi:hypothetical protein